MERIPGKRRGDELSSPITFSRASARERKIIETQDRQREWTRKRHKGNGHERGKESFKSRRRKERKKAFLESTQANIGENSGLEAAGPGRKRRGWKKKRVMEERKEEEDASSEGERSRARATDQKRWRGQKTPVYERRPKKKQQRQKRNLGRCSSAQNDGR